MQTQYILAEVNLPLLLLVASENLTVNFRIGIYYWKNKCRNENHTKGDGVSGREIVLFHQ